MTCKQCKNYDECQFDAACNNAVFDPDASAEYCTGAEPITNADRIRAMSDAGIDRLCGGSRAYPVTEENAPPSKIHRPRQ